MSGAPINRMAGRNQSTGSGPICSEVYYAGWPKKGLYNDDLNWACRIGINYLKQIAPITKNQNKIGIIVLDIDDTLVMGDHAPILGIREQERIEDNQEIFILPINKQVKALAVTARNLGLKIVILTARPLSSKAASICNLQDYDIPYDMIIMNDKDSDPMFKVKVRRSLDNDKRQIVLTVGDQPFDCFSPGKAAAIKLPDPDCKCAYVYIP